ncbi:MAG: putative rane protein [Herbinix sp.]|jgi:hypothetical protein|nr:putative rane protein [Herbinix sp.]
MFPDLFLLIINYNTRPRRNKDTLINNTEYDKMYQRCEVIYLGQSAKNGTLGTRNKKNGSTKRKHNAINLFIKGFLQSFFIVGILLVIGVVSYKATMHFWKGSDQEAVVAYKEQPAPEPITVASIDDVSKNLIYCYDEDTYEISKIILEIFNCEKKQLTYITIPIRTQFTMSDSLYRKLVLVHPAIPQMIKLSTITNYLDKDTEFDYGVLMIEDLLGIDISYYTAIPQATFDTIFTEQDILPESSGQIDTSVTEMNDETNMSTDQTTEQPVPLETFTEEYIALISTLKTAEEVSTYIEEIYPSLQSNLSVKDKMNYLESYCNTPSENISFERIKGVDLNNSFEINQELALQQLTELMEKSATN